MTKAEIVNKINLETGISRDEVLSIIEAFMSETKKSLSNGESVTLRGFGSFLIKHRAEKVARVISRNTSMIVPAHDIPAFKPADEFMQRLKK